MNIWDNRERQHHAPFDIIIQTTPETVPLRDMFDDSINPDTGKSYYDVDDKHYDLKSFVYDNGMIDEAKTDAKIWLDNTKEVVYD